MVRLKELDDPLFAELAQTCKDGPLPLIALSVHIGHLPTESVDQASGIVPQVCRITLGVPDGCAGCPIEAGVRVLAGLGPHADPGLTGQRKAGWKIVRLTGLVVEGPSGHNLIADSSILNQHVFAIPARSLDVVDVQIR